MLLRFPLEVIEKVFSYCSIRDVELCLEAYGNLQDRYSDMHFWDDDREPLHKHQWYDKLWQSAKSRVDPRLYLNTHFSNPTELLNNMVLNDVCISGSRALEFFVGDATDSNSDWDFYIPNNHQKIFNFMEYMKSIGVKWHNTLEYFKSKIDNEEEEMSMSFLELHFLSKTKRFQSNPQYLVQCIEDLVMQYEEKADSIDEIRSYPDSFKLSCRRKDQSIKYIIIVPDAYQFISLIHGSLKHKQREISIQLIIVDNKTNSVLDALLSFHISIVQCVITGFMAVHMYANDAYSRNSKIWATDYADCEVREMKILQSIQKYMDRGFKFFRPRYHVRFVDSKVPVIKRVIGDESCEVIHFNIDRSLHENLITIKKDRMYDFSWLQSVKLSNNYYSQEQQTQSDNDIDYFDSIASNILDRDDINSPQDYESPNIDSQYYVLFRILDRMTI